MVDPPRLHPFLQVKFQWLLKASSTTRGVRGLGILGKVLSLGIKEKDENGRICVLGLGDQRSHKGGD